MNGYELSRNWFDFAFENNSKITANHGILFFWLIEINNRLGWAKEFQITAKECMQGMGCHSYNTYKKCLDDLIKWEFIILKRKAVNQFQTNIIALSNNNNPLYKAMDKALTKHGIKQSESTIQSTGDIHKPKTKKQTNKEDIPLLTEFLEQTEISCKKANLNFKQLKFAIESKYETWVADGWKDGHGKKIKNWKNKISNTLPFLKAIKQKTTTQYGTFN